MTRPRCLELLDLPTDATLTELRVAYRDLVNVWHPDRYAHNPRLQEKALRKLQELNAAYEEAWRLLSDHPPRTTAEVGPAPSGDAPDQPPDDAPSAPDRWRGTEARLRALYRHRQRRTHRAQREPAGPDGAARRPAEEVPRRRIGEVELAAAKDARGDIGRSALWQSTEQRLKAMAVAREAERRRREAEAARRRAEAEAARRAARWRRRGWRLARWLAAAALLLAAGGLVRVHGPALLTRLLQWLP